jgi:hypothetical protein
LGVALPRFDGTRDLFQVWWMQFSAFATMNRFAAAIQEEAEEDLPQAESTEEEDTEEEGLARGRNRVAMYYLTLAFHTYASQRFLFLGMTQEWPNGLAWMVVRALFRAFRPRDNLSKIEMRVSMNSVTMNRKDSPEVLFSQLSSIQNRYGIQATEEELIATVVMQSPSEYKPIISAMQLLKSEMTLNDLEVGMLNFWRSTYGIQQDQSNEDVQQLYETAMVAQGKKRSTKCTRCGKRGHEEAKCWDDPANANSRPSWYKANAMDHEVTNCTVDYEVLCGAIDKKNSDLNKNSKVCPTVDLDTRSEDESEDESSYYYYLPREKTAEEKAESNALFRVLENLDVYLDDDEKPISSDCVEYHDVAEDDVMVW